ncbi:MAG: NRDE family protein [Geobacteraceae bacterium]|nr:NRDE family protein [Geobacteraceae bacterium]
MCLILFAFRCHPRYSLVMAANRDEFFERPTAPARFWDTNPEILGGRDLKCGGTWLAMALDGRFAAVVNYRDPDTRKDDAPSRGDLATDFLLGNASSEDYLKILRKKAGRYNGFTLLFGDAEHLLCFSNRGSAPYSVQPGIHGISNHLLDTPWPKVVRGRKALEGILSCGTDPPVEAMFSMLADRTMPDDNLLPETGIGPEWERLLAPIFISGPVYGTRSSTVLMIGYDGMATFIERTFDGSPDIFTTSEFSFRIES